MKIIPDNVVTTPTTTKHNLNTVVGLDTKIAVQTPPPYHPTTKTLQKPSGLHSLTTTEYNVAINNKCTTTTTFTTTTTTTTIKSTGLGASN